MENQLQFIIEKASLTSAHSLEHKEEVFDILKKDGEEHFVTLGNVVFSTNEYGILKGIGFDSMGNFKIWNNRKFGVFKK